MTFSCLGRHQGRGGVSNGDEEPRGRRTADQIDPRMVYLLDIVCAGAGLVLEWREHG